MKIATFNVNGVNGRLPVLLRWLDETSPDVVCLQELKSETFPQSAVRAAGYEAIWQGQKSWNGVAILTRGKVLVETRRALPGADDDLHSRYIEAAVDGLLIGCLYVPNGNPVKSEKFSFKLRWFERLIAHAAELLATGAPVARSSAACAIKRSNQLSLKLNFSLFTGLPFGTYRQPIKRPSTAASM